MDEDVEEDDEDDDDSELEVVLLDNSITDLSSVPISSFFLLFFDDVSEDVRLPRGAGRGGTSSSSIASLSTWIASRCFSARADPMACASVI